MLNPSGKAIKINKEFTRLFGYTLADVEKGEVSLAPEELMNESNMILEKTKAGKKVILQTKRFKKNGESVEVEIIAGPIKKNNQLIAIYVVWKNLSELKESERRARKNEERFLAIFEGSRDALFITDQQAHFVAVNQAACKLTGYSREELLQMRIPDLHEEADLEAYKQYFHRILRGESILSEAKILRKDGQKIDVEFSNNIIFLDGTPYIHTVARDISEWKKDKERIKAFLREKDVMLQEIHHRVKNNMQIIISLMRIQARKVKNARFSKYLQALQDRVYSMSLIHDHFYKERQLDKINIATYIKELINHLFYIHGHKDNKIKINLAIDKIYLDLNKAVPFGMLINEIITNILKHAFPQRKKGEIFLRLYQDGNKKIHLLISDTGVGLPSEVDIENPTTMGLQLMKDLTQQLKGEIQIESEQGTKIKVVFPSKN